MTNKWFYNNKLLAIALEKSCRKLHETAYGESCAGKQCKNCGFNSVEKIMQWLNAEHEEPEPPLLENGDGLKPGDWIMVRNENSNAWSKRQFMCYFQSLNRPFVTLEESYSWYLGQHECWAQARLPKEGE